MRLLIQKVKSASVTVENEIIGKIGRGLLVFVGIEDRDTQEDIDWLVNKTILLRVFEDENGVMNKSLLDVKGELLLVSQFTLQASTKKGNRPSYLKASKPEIAIPMYEKMIQSFEKALQHPIPTGKFGADMEIALINDGPTTIWIDSQNKE
ncbi:D-aminoacyl-tRNA deacylase [Rhizosphaericola mali]|uniref:D-aminoacyl-tRNA deacylase n=1 Tax=Rhizosphaericola mali TaxID=2545455 RepID=A0A5P2G1Q3_9BACT|nr:D-aminoacyl-tRNA deacylase [Rhizosphaericola mali]QES87770.1 D-tyrosyl-tRNA(Tyr) deacylase [Rhizosphaericola mali]